MLALIAMAHALSASSAKLEDWVKQGIQDKYADASHRINRSTGATTEEILETYEDLFFRACPKFVTPIAPALPNLDEDEDAASMPTPNDPTKHQWLLFQSDVKSLLGVSDMRSFLKLYTTLSTDKMASLLGRSEEEVGEELAVVKGALRSFKWTSGSLLEGEYENTGDVAFSIEDVSRTPFLRCLSGGEESHRAPLRYQKPEKLVKLPITSCEGAFRACMGNIP
jgi:translation initiation factor 3 subunit L